MTLVYTPSGQTMSNGGASDAEDLDAECVRDDKYRLSAAIVAMKVDPTCSWMIAVEVVVLLSLAEKIL